MENPRVTIIVPVFNTERYVEECIYSAILQDYRNIEIIAVNDGSTDNSGKILETIKSNYPSLRIISTKNRGQSAARNTALTAATGDFIIFLDSDDSLEPNTISKCMRIIKEHDVDIVLFEAYAYCDGTPTLLMRNFNYERPKALHNKKLNSRDYFKESIERDCYIVSPCLYLYKREKLSDIEYLEGAIHEDNLFTTRLLLENNNCNVFCIPDKLFKRRIRPNSIMTQEKNARHTSGYLKVAKELLKIKEFPLPAPAARALYKFIQITLQNAVIAYTKTPYQSRQVCIKKEAFNILKELPKTSITAKTFIFCLTPEAVTFAKKIKLHLRKKK